MLPVADLVLAAALPLSTQAARLTGHGRPETARARDAEGPITPAAGAFAIWAPIFGCLAAYGVQRIRLREDTRAAHVLASAAMAASVAWNFDTQLAGINPASVGLIATSATTATAAVAAFERANTPLARAGRGLLAPFAGWLSVATFANLEATKRMSPYALLGGATAAVLAGVEATRGNPLYAAAAAWGLGGIVVKHVRTRPRLAALAALGLAAVVAATIRKRGILTR